MHFYLEGSRGVSHTIPYLPSHFPLSVLPGFLSLPIFSQPAASLIPLKTSLLLGVSVLLQSLQWLPLVMR